MATKFLNTRRRTEKEVRDKLRMEKIGSEIIDEIVENLLQANLIDDEAFARAAYLGRVRLFVLVHLLQPRLDFVSPISRRLKNFNNCFKKPLTPPTGPI